MSKPTPRPFFDVNWEYKASLEHFIHQSGMLLDAVASLLSMGAVKGEPARILEERLKALHAASTSDSE